MKRTGFAKKISKPMKRTRIRVAGKSTTSEDKKEIQHLVRLNVVIRDGGCVLREVRKCGAVATVWDEKVVSESVIQADHLITRSNSATYADTRLIVCICRPCHGWKHWHEKEYEALVKSILPKQRVQLWERCEESRQAHRTHKADWKVEILALKCELSKRKQTL